MKNKRFNPIKDTIKHNISQILAITEKNIKLNIRFKYHFIMRFIDPIISIIMPLIIFNKLFDFNQSFGPWTPETYGIFLLSTYNLQLLVQLIGQFPGRLSQEKFWKTLPALMIAPFNRFDLLIGIFLSHLILISIPFTIFFLIALILYPISIFTIIFILLIYLLIAFIFSGIGLLEGAFAVSKENIWRFISFILKFVFWASCISYPFDLYPKIIQDVISLNPLYYIFTFLRMAWIQNNFLITIIYYWFHFLVIFGTAIILPILAVVIFNKVFRKYGIVGY